MECGGISGIVFIGGVMSGAGGELTAKGLTAGCSMGFIGKSGTGFTVMFVTGNGFTVSRGLIVSRG